MNAELQRRGEDEAMKRVVITIAVDREWTAWVRRILTKMPKHPGDYQLLGLLREGLHRLVELRASGHRIHRAPVPEAAE